MESTKNTTANEFIQKCIIAGIQHVSENANDTHAPMSMEEDEQLSLEAKRCAKIVKDFDLCAIAREKYREIIEKQIRQIKAIDAECGERFRRIALSPEYFYKAFMNRSVQLLLEATTKEWAESLQHELRATFGYLVDEAERRESLGNAIPETQSEQTAKPAKARHIAYPVQFMPHIYVKYKECPRTTYYPSLKALYTSIVGEANMGGSTRCPLHFQHDASKIQAHDLSYQERIDWLKKQVCRLVSKNIPNRTVEHIERINRDGVKYIA